MNKFTGELYKLQILLYPCNFLTRLRVKNIFGKYTYIPKIILNHFIYIRIYTLTANRRSDKKTIIYSLVTNIFFHQKTS